MNLHIRPSKVNIENLYNEIYIQSIEDRLKLSSLKMMFKIVNNDAPVPLCQILPKQKENPYTLRSKEVIREPFCRLEVFKRSFFPRTIKLWNQLPNHIHGSESLSVFKRYLTPESPEILALYYYGERWLQYIMRG